MNKDIPYDLNCLLSDAESIINDDEDEDDDNEY